MTPAPGLYKGQSFYDQSEQILFAQRGQSRVAFPTYKNIDYTNHLLKFEQNKTKGHSANSGVVIPLNDGLLSLIGEDPENLDSSIFNLPTYESCCKSVKRWVKRAGINKHISWHMARHTFGTLALSAGIPIESIAKMMGHTSIASTQI